MEGAAGRPAFDPQLLVSLWIDSYGRGVSSARAIERRCEYDPAYQWLTGMTGIGAHTLSDCRIDHFDALRDLFVQVLWLLSAEGLITLEGVMHDGTKVRANAASTGFRTQSRIEAHLAQAQAAVVALEAESEGDVSLQAQRARARATRERRARLQAACEQFEQLHAADSTITRVSTTDPDARIMKDAQGGTSPHYNVQVTTDAAHSVIVGVAATQAGSDYRQLPARDGPPRWRLGKAPGQVVVDGGYVSSANIAGMADRAIDLLAPTPTERGAAANRAKAYKHLCSEEQRRLMAVVRAAAQLDVARVRRAASGERHHVVEFQESTLRAPSARADERAASSVTAPDLTPYG